MLVECGYTNGVELTSKLSQENATIASSLFAFECERSEQARVSEQYQKLLCRVV